MHFDNDNPPHDDPASLPESVSESSPTTEPSPWGNESLPPEVRALPEELRVPWGWSELSLLIFLALGGTFLIGIFLVKVFAILGISPAHLQQSDKELGFLNVLTQIFVDLFLLGYLAAQMRLGYHVPFWRTIGWRHLETDRIPRPFVYLSLIFGGFFLALVVSLTSSFFPPKNPLPIQMILQNQRTALLFMLTAVLIAPVVEETVFRGYLYPVAARTFGVTGGILLTGVLFGLMHSAQLGGAWWQVSLLMIVGIIFTWVRAVTRTVFASFLLHLSYNSLEIIAFLIASHGLRNLSGLH